MYSTVMGTTKNFFSRRNKTTKTIVDFQQFVITNVFLFFHDQTFLFEKQTKKKEEKSDITIIEVKKIINDLE